MEESSDRTSSVMSSSGNNKMNSDSGYGSNSNKSNNSQSQRSSGSSKSHQSSSSGSLVSHPGATQPTIDQLVQQAGGGSQGSTANSSKTRSEKDYKRKKKSKGKPSASPKEPEQRASTIVEEGGKKNAPEPPSSSQPTNPPAIPETPQQASPESRTSAPCDSKALQMAALTHALSCIKKFRDQDLDLNEDSGDEMSTDSIWSEQFGMLKDDLNMTEQQNSFGAVVSMEDGLVVYITEEITQILGYPKDMWMGRSFMDLIHPKDKMAFASQFTFSGGITFPNAGEQNLGQNTPNAIGGLNTSPPQGLESFFCRLRQYRGLKTTGFGVADKAVSFFPFRLTLKLKEIEGAQKAKSPKILPQEGEPEDMTDKKSVYLFIGATRISSAYQYPEEVPINPEKFVTRHSATCQFGHLDPNAVKFLGHLPQDVVGQSVLDYYHPDDLLLLREIYEGVMAERGKPFKSKPYRFRVHNGSFATLETDWSCFINPWSWKLEFVIGQHKVVKGPLNPNVFMPPKSEAAHLEDSQESKVLQEQIKHLLAETVTRRIAEPLKQQSSRRKKDLAVLLETLLDQIGNNETSDQSDSVGSTPFSVLERDSAMLGEISPHHDDHSGSNQSSETPPSYNQLNYRENIERFFLSHPKTTRESDESADAAKNEGTDLPTGSTEDDESKGSPNGSSDSAIRQSGSQEEHTEASAEGTNDSEHPCSLTEDSLLRHNEDMEKYMVRRHRETRGRNASYGSASHKNGRNKLSEQMKRRMRTEQTKGYHLDDSFLKGNKANHLKRTGNLAGWASTGSSRKANKQAHMELPTTNYSESMQAERVSSVNLWPPYSVGMTQGAVTPTYTAGMGSTIPVATIQYLHRAPNPSVAPARPAVLTQPQVPFVGVHNEPQYFPQQRVPCTMPGLANIIYNQSLGTHAYYGQQGRLYTAAAPLIMGTGGGPVMAPVAPRMHPVPAPLLPTVPRVMQQLGIPAATIPIRPLQPNLAPMNPVPAGIQLNSLPGPSGLPMMISAPAVVTVPSTFTTSSPSTSPQLCYSLSGQRLVRGQQQARNDVGANAVSKAAAVLQNVRLTKQVGPSLRTKRISNLKATADFSSSDGFGDSSSSSLYSLCRNTSDMSSSAYTCREDKDSYESAERFQPHSSDRFQSHSSDIDHDMIWKNHLEKTQDGCGARGRRLPRLSKKPPWQQNLDMTPELSFRYEISIADMSEVLRKDLDKLKIMGNQPALVDEQLGELYNELKMEGKQTDLHLEEGSSSYSVSLPSSGTEEDETDTEGRKEKAALEAENKKRASEGKKNKLTRIDYDKMVQVFEENAPFPKANK